MTVVKIKEIGGTLKDVNNPVAYTCIVLGLLYRKITMNTDPGYSYLYTCTSCVVLRMSTSSLRLVKSPCHFHSLSVISCKYIGCTVALYVQSSEIITDIIQSVV